MTLKRRIAIVLILLILILAILSRVLYLQVFGRSFFEHQGAQRSSRVVTVQPPRAMILDRQGSPLAVSIPVATIWVNPTQLRLDQPEFGEMLKDLGLDAQAVQESLLKSAHQQFLYLKRQVPPKVGQSIQARHLPGVYVSQEYRRYYPEGAATATLLGFTNIDGVGQEGLEAQYNAQLAGQNGQKKITQDVLGRVIEETFSRDPVASKPLTLTIDKYFQSVVYRALLQSFVRNKASSASAVILDAKTGEILAMVSLPSFNPNQRESFKTDAVKNRAVTDLFEPGSVMKPFAMATALDFFSAHQADSKTLCDLLNLNSSCEVGAPDHPDADLPDFFNIELNTAPGFFKLGGHIIRDGDGGDWLSLAQILARSSNIGISRLVLATDPTALPNFMSDLGFGQPSGLHFPGESVGRVPKTKLQPFALATLSFGYGLSVNALQLARAFDVFANQGNLPNLSLVKQEGPALPQQSVLSPELANQVLKMLQEVIQSKEGTGRKAQVPGYLVAGKTGTSRKAVPGGYAEDAYTAVFAGIMPAKDPRWVMVIVVDDPRGDRYYGGSVAAPVFSQVMKKLAWKLK